MLKVSDIIYKNMNTEERCQASLIALARGDNAEVDKLGQTASKKNYSALDYILKMNAIENISSRFGMLCQYHERKAFMYEMYYLQALMNKLLEAKTLCQRFEAAISDLKAAHDGFEAFCEKVGIKASYIIQWFALHELCPDLNKYLKKDIPANSEYKAYVETKFLELWNA